MSAAAHVAAIALRGRIASDLQVQRAALESLRKQQAEGDVGAHDELAAYEAGDVEAAVDLRADIDRHTQRLQRTERALHQADARVLAERRAETVAYLKAQAPQIAKLRKRFIAAAAELVDCFDALAEFEHSIESHGLLPLMAQDLIEKTTISAPRCGHSEFHAHLRNQVRGK